jgi:hypothetical protein
LSCGVQNLILERSFCRGVIPTSPQLRQAFEAENVLIWNYYFQPKTATPVKSSNSSVFFFFYVMSSFGNP